MNTLFKCDYCNSFDLVIDNPRDKFNRVKLPITLVCRNCLFYEVLEDD